MFRSEWRVSKFPFQGALLPKALEGLDGYPMLDKCHVKAGDMGTVV